MSENVMLSAPLADSVEVAAMVRQAWEMGRQGWVLGEVSAMTPAGGGALPVLIATLHRDPGEWTTLPPPGKTGYYWRLVNSGVPQPVKVSGGVAMYGEEYYGAPGERWWSEPIEAPEPGVVSE